MGGDVSHGNSPTGRGLFDLEDVRRFGKYASHRAGDGRLFEFDQGRFWVSHVDGAGNTRELVIDHEILPDGPWRHSPVCGCKGCVPR